jgi:hypothetical protein
MTSLSTYPKFSPIAFLDFELQQKGVKQNLNFHSKSISQTMVMLCKTCRSTLTETNKIDFAFFWIFCEFLGFSEGAGLTCKETTIIFLTTMLLVYTSALGISQPCPWRRRRLAGGERHPDLANKWRRGAIGLTTRRLVVVAWLEVAPASSDVEVVAACPLRLWFWRGWGKCKATSCGGSSSGV